MNYPITQIRLYFKNFMFKLGGVKVGKNQPVRIMGILNISPESFYKKSIKTTKKTILDTVTNMEIEGADFIDVGGMSTAPYLSTVVSEKIETKRVLNAIKIIQNKTNLPISVDTCRANVARAVLEQGIEIINDISGLKYDKRMKDVISEFRPSMILCAYDSKTVLGNDLKSTKKLLVNSLKIAKKSHIPQNKIVIDPSIGFFRKSGAGSFFTKIDSDWIKRDLSMISNLEKFNLKHPILISVSNKSFIGRILNKEKTIERLFGSLAMETVGVLHGANIIRTHNVSETKDVITIASKFLKR